MLKQREVWQELWKCKSWFLHTVLFICSLQCLEHSASIGVPSFKEVTSFQRILIIVTLKYLLWGRQCFKFFNSLNSHNTMRWVLILSSILHFWKWMHREVKKLTLGHAASRWQSLQSGFRVCTFYHYTIQSFRTLDLKGPQKSSHFNSLIL